MESCRCDVGESVKRSSVIHVLRGDLVAVNGFWNETDTDQLYTLCGQILLFVASLPITTAIRLDLQSRRQPSKYSTLCDHTNSMMYDRTAEHLFQREEKKQIFQT